MRLSTVLGPVLDPLRSSTLAFDLNARRGVSSDDLGVMPSAVISATSCDPACFGPGDASGDKEGKDSSVFADVGVTREDVDVTSECLRDFDVRTMPDLREVVEVWEEVRSSVLSDECRGLAILRS